jgi:hypothetical protein
MDTSLFLAKILGLYLLIMGIAMLLKGNSIKVIIHNVVSSPPLVFISGAITLFIGILLITNYNVWHLDWFLAITIIGWICIIRGLMCLFFPIMAVHVMKKFLHNDVLFYTTTIIIIAIGIILSYLGFTLILT